MYIRNLLKLSPTSTTFYKSKFSMSLSYDYDLVVIGGGSGGLSAAKEAKANDPSKRVLVFDFVQPSGQGTKWGLGGTCVNVGCVPKKLMHYSSLLGHSFDHANQYGWDINNVAKHDWVKMRNLICDYIKSLNFIYKNGLKSAAVKYEEAYATFTDPHTLQWKSKFKSGVVTTDKVLIATGGRPAIPNIKGKELCITSDDLFWLKQSPGKTLVIGAGYIALECAGFLHHIGNDVSVIVRGELLRKFDRQAANQIAETMERDGVRFLLPASPLELTREKEGDQIKVAYTFNNDPSKTVHYEFFDTVLCATGRNACVGDLNLDKAGVKIFENKVLVDKYERTTADNIYAIGDVATDLSANIPSELLNATERPELTPVAIAAGKLLAQRLFGKKTELMNYNMVPTVIFTPQEYGVVGLSQEQAEADEKDGGIGYDNVEVFYSRFGNLEISPIHPHFTETRSNAFIGKNLWMRNYARTHKLNWAESGLVESAKVSVTGHSVNGEITAARQNNQTGNYEYDVKLENGTELTNIDDVSLDLVSDSKIENSELFVKANCLAKVVCDKRANNKVIGFHFIGPNAGEVLQGFALAVKLGITMDDLDNLVGIHPTAAEEFAVLSVTKSSMKTPMKKAGCGGGSCG